MRFRNGAQVVQKQAEGALQGRFQSAPGALHRHSKNSSEAFGDARQGGVSTDLGRNGAIVALPFTLK